MQDEEEMAEDARNPVRVDMRFHNHVTLMGRVTRHPKTVGQGNTEITFFDLITKRFYENESGEVTEDPHYHTIMVTNKTRGIHNYVKNTVKKGDRVYVEGSLRYNIKQLEDGKSRKDPSIVGEDLNQFLDQNILALKRRSREARDTRPSPIPIPPLVLPLFICLSLFEPDGIRLRVYRSLRKLAA